MDEIGVMPRLHELCLASMWACHQPLAPVSAQEVEALAGEVDGAYERAAGLTADVQPEVRPMLEALIPSVEYRRGVARILAAQRRHRRHLLIDHSLWENVIVFAMAEAVGIRPIKYAIKLRRPRRELVRRYCPLLAKAHLAAKVRE